MSRLLAYGVGLGLTAAALSPALRPLDRDSYPLSTYPMFTASRDEVVVHQIVGVRGASRTVLPPSLVVGGPEVMQAAATVRRSAEAGPARLAALCRAVLGRAAEASEWRDVERLDIVAAHFDPIAYLTGSREPRRRDVLATCAPEGKP